MKKYKRKPVVYSTITVGKSEKKIKCTYRQIK